MGAIGMEIFDDDHSSIALADLVHQEDPIKQIQDTLKEPIPDADNGAYFEVDETAEKVVAAIFLANLLDFDSVLPKSEQEYPSYVVRDLKKVYAQVQGSSELQVLRENSQLLKEMARKWLKFISEDEERSEVCSLWREVPSYYEEWKKHIDWISNVLQ
ncbi:Hypothetical protein PP7435_CHR1-1009 [Komagataella phaffii CBS 7435]|uniref:Uncharacterized protein n=2 Tax=Komagataella phaffii TaxID=460519 RepID=C4QXU1_KOMPG|nr:Hypothetical protein PAS_chr1-4_0229 [Komagataella phaffii GS115]AOA60583.1 GQ67_01946T0 [Komagataella phaffii]CAH2446881.1 Hypothetical protein BQ9382_C1-5305 [Komagataella phaffii CBS 7435]AOA66265.1 GQ68_01961T0 [Komagataella phaffii GS115]CAY68064.1 Hypothetical protein PAS_chr1-4_0229 [Komagataella phaffii GS115]CCA37139.1 Hypothetical protein PP7435_CHR1-1009 [Komagataella phaffii CBS 7435]